ncbi:MAG: hypothetical protein NVS3B16_19660 [Vulcanimicrobiaceae bacterium]
MNGGPIRVLYIPANGKAGYREIANSLASLFELVGEGQLDVVELASNISLFCDESRSNREFAYNFSVGSHHVHGDAFIVRRSGMEAVSIEEADVARLMSAREAALGAERM